MTDDKSNTNSFSIDRQYKNCSRVFDKNPLPFLPQMLCKKTTLEREAVHLWRIHYRAINTDHTLQLFRQLSTEEQLRAERYHFVDDQQRFIIRHGLLRILLGNYLNGEPSELEIQQNENGKPFLTETTENEVIQFSLSHSKEIILYAFGRRRRIGVDIEFIQPMTDMDAVVGAYFSESEKEEYKNLPQEQRLESFYHCWTKKEAFLKALGKGLSLGLDTFTVPLKPGAPTELQRDAWNVQEAGQWVLKSIDSIPGYAAAVAVEGCNWTLVEID